MLFICLSLSTLLQNAEYSILRELSLLVNNLNVCLNEESRLIGNFWLSQLPARYKKGQMSKLLQNKKVRSLRFS